MPSRSPMKCFRYSHTLKNGMPMEYLRYFHAFFGVRMSRSNEGLCCCSTLEHTGTQCSMLQHTTAHCSTLQHNAAYCSTL